MGDFNDSKAYPEDPVFLPSVLVDIASAMTLGGDASEASASRYAGTVGKSPKTAAIILAGGSGERFGHEGGKQLVEIAGRPILAWSVAAFDAVEDIGLIVVVCPSDRADEYRERAIDPFSFVTPLVLAPSRGSRQASEL